MSEKNSAVLPAETAPDLSGESIPPQGSKKNVFLVMGGVSCVFLLCLGLFIGSGIFLVRGASTAPAENEVVVLPEVEETPQAEVSGDVFDDNEPDAEMDEVSRGAPKMSPLSFALATTANGEPVEPDFLFAAGTTRIYALFEYANLTPAHTWSQAWYYNGSELSRTSQPWLAESSGSYDYIIEAGGEPLPPGEWALEFYINDELLTAGSFIIEGAEDPFAADRPDLAELPQLYLLVYPKWNDEKHNLYMNDTNGSQEQFILGRAAGPSWSLDSRYIFVYGEEGIDQLYPQSGVSNGIMRLTATGLPANPGQIQLYQGHGWNDGTARWANVAPDGTMIAYDGDRGGGRRIYFLGTAANQQFRYEIIGEQADWSPDSQKIVYRSGRNNQTGLWISNRTDSGHIRITVDGSDSFSAWSPDGQTIAFSREVGGNVDIYIVNVDGSDVQRLTNTPGHDTLPAYLPNGDLVFRSARGGSWSIWKMKGDGSDHVEIVPNAPVGPDWSFSRIGVLR